MVWNGDNIPGIDLRETGRRISALIDESGFSDRELGKIMNISVQSINKWRHGYNLPDIENLYFLSRLLEIKVDDFLVPIAGVPQSEMGFQPVIEDFSTAAMQRSWMYFTRLKQIC